MTDEDEDGWDEIDAERCRVESLAISMDLVSLIAARDQMDRSEWRARFDDFRRSYDATTIAISAIVALNNLPVSIGQITDALGVGGMFRPELATA